MRRGFTTGSCAAAAAKAAAYMLLSGRVKTRIQISTPGGEVFDAELVDVKRGPDEVSCGVVKDGGDDPDVTTGSVVVATVSFGDGETRGVEIDGGDGVGRVTKPGLDQPVGAAAINSVPRAMIEREVREVMDVFDYPGTLRVVVSVPGGDELARRTFNPRFGIEGGVSILGTTGIVEPMSDRAILETIRVELRQNRALGATRVAIAPGNYGLEFMKESFAFDLDRAVKCSNYIGDAIDMAAELGFTEILLCGHLGKLVKVSGGIMNTHSSVADCRMELMAAAAGYAGVSTEGIRQILDCVSTDAAYDIVVGEGCEAAFMARVMERIEFYLKKRAAGRLGVECVVFTKVFGLLGETPGARGLLKRLTEEPL